MLYTILKVLICQGLVLAVFIYVSYKILQRDRKLLNILISGFYLCASIGFLINYLFVFLSFDPLAPIVLVLYYLTMILLLLAPFFLTLFTIVLLKTEELFSKKRQIFFFLLYFIFVLGMILIPDGITINQSTNWYPIYNYYYYLYVLLIFSIFSVIPQIYGFIKIYRSFSQESLLNRWKLFVIGTFCYYFVAYATLTYNLLNIDILRLILGFISLGFSIIAAILIYYGIVKL